MALYAAGSSIAGKLASSSSACVYTVARAALHNSAVLCVETQRQRMARIVRKTNLEKKDERARIWQETKPHVVLGTRPGDEAKWQNCDLAKVLATEAELSFPSQGQQVGDVGVPKYLSYGLDGTDGAGSRDEKMELFFKDLPTASSEHHLDPVLLADIRRRRGTGSLTSLGNEQINVARKFELKKASQLARVVDLRNANARGIAFENRRRIIAAFSPSADASDSGYPEVQVALLTMKIRGVWEHLMRSKKDIEGRLALRKLVHQRAKMLKYIKRIDRDRYDRILERVALEPESVEGELVV